ncbi:MAG: DoxX family protein [Pseudolabrys sp.]|nr:DoxX family protein [Pseudolabrys sp.]MBV9954396.1 DoxX family protein [Pseudolabrys sp.]
MLANNRSSLPALSYADTLAASTSDVMLLIGRILLGWIFVRSGYGKLFDIAAYSNTFPGRGLPAFLAYVAVPVEFFGGVALIFGLATRYVTIVMIAFMLVATFSSHRYWEYTDPNVRRFQDASFWKNISMLGGFFVFFITGPGRLSVDNWLRGKA